MGVKSEVTPGYGSGGVGIRGVVVDSKGGCVGAQGIRTDFGNAGVWGTVMRVGNDCAGGRNVTADIREGGICVHREFGLEAGT